MIVSVSNPDLKLSFVKPEVLNRKSGQGVCPIKDGRTFVFARKVLSFAGCPINQTEIKESFTFIFFVKQNLLYFLNISNPLNVSNCGVLTTK